MSQLVPDVGTPGRLTAPGWLAALALLTGVRLGVAGFTPLSPDEAYYWVWSRALAPGYLDHPPMVALWIRAGAWLAGEGAFGIRLLGPLSAALGSVLLAQAAADLLPGRGAGPRAAALLNATLLLGVGAVTMTPDAPLLLFWTAALWALARLLRLLEEGMSPHVREAAAFVTAIRDGTPLPLQTLRGPDAETADDMLAVLDAFRHGRVSLVEHVDGGARRVGKALEKVRGRGG